MKSILTKNLKKESVSISVKERKLSLLDEEDGFISFLFSSFDGFNVEERKAALSKNHKFIF